MEKNYMELPNSQNDKEMEVELIPPPEVLDFEVPLSDEERVHAKLCEIAQDGKLGGRTVEEAEKEFKARGIIVETHELIALMMGFKFDDSRLRVKETISVLERIQQKIEKGEIIEFPNGRCLTTIEVEPQEDVVPPN